MTQALAVFVDQFGIRSDLEKPIGPFLLQDLELGLVGFVRDGESVYFAANQSKPIVGLPSDLQIGIRKCIQ